MSVSPQVTFLSGGACLRLQHGQIDLIVGADGNRFNALFAAQKCFDTLSSSLEKERRLLCAPLTDQSRKPKDPIARRMFDAVLPFSDNVLAPIICVAGTVADTVLHAVTQIKPLTRAYVKNGGHIALFLSPGETFSSTVVGPDGQQLGTLCVSHYASVGGIATSGRTRPIPSVGIADAVTVLASDAATADVAATLIANAVDLPGHPAIRREPSDQATHGDDLDAPKIVTDCSPLSEIEIEQALRSGVAVAQTMISKGQIVDASLFLQGYHCLLGTGFMTPANSRQIIVDT